MEKIKVFYEFPNFFSELKSLYLEKKICFDIEQVLPNCKFFLIYLEIKVHYRIILEIDLFFGPGWVVQSVIEFLLGEYHYNQFINVSPYKNLIQAYQSKQLQVYFDQHKEYFF